MFKDLDVAAFEEVLREWVKDSGADLSGVGGWEDPAGDSRGDTRGASGVGIRPTGGGADPDGHGGQGFGGKVLLGQISLEGKIVVADALLTQREVQQIADGGGDYLLPVKENQPTLQQDLADAFSPSGKQKGPRAGSRRNGGSEGPR